MKEGDKPYRDFGEDVKNENFFPRFLCDKCDHQFSGKYAFPKGARIGGAICNKCANNLFVDVERSEIFNLYKFDLDNFTLDQISSVILDNIKPCECGGSFGVHHIAKCPRCFQELNDSVLAYPYVEKFKEKAFNSDADYLTYQQELDKLCAHDKLYYHHGTQLATRYFNNKTLKKYSEADREKIKKDSLPLITTRVFSADKWLIENPKRNLFEIFIQRLYAVPSYQKLPPINVIACQYNAAYVVSLLAKSPFAQMRSVFLPTPEYEEKMKELEERMGNRGYEIFAALKLFQNGEYIKAFDLYAKLGLSDEFAKLEQWRESNKNEIEIPWAVKAEVEIKKWRLWWETNKNLLPV